MVAVAESPTLGRGVRRRRTIGQRARRVASRHLGGSVGVVVLFLVALVALFASQLATHDPTALSPADRLTPPSSDHFFGTDNFGRDVFSRTVYGARVSLLVGFGVSLVAILVGTVVGLIAGYDRRSDGPLMRIMDAIMAFPGIILAIGIVAATGPSVVNVIVALGAVYTPTVARVTRSVVLGLRESQFVEAARAIGVPTLRIVVRHILVNAWSPLIVQGTFIFAAGVLGEATLSFLGVGTPPITPSWGNMLGEARTYIRSAYWLMLLPGLALTITVLSLNLLGDGVRDLLDPRLRRRL